MVTDVFLLESHMLKRRQCQWMLFLSWNYSLPPSRKHTHTLTVALGAATDFHVPLWWAQRDLGQPPYHDCPLYTLAEASALQVWKWVLQRAPLIFVFLNFPWDSACALWELSDFLRCQGWKRDQRCPSCFRKCKYSRANTPPQHVTNSLQLPHSQNLSNLSATPQRH